MKTAVFVAMATMLPGIFLMQASGGSTVAVIDFERAVSEAPGGKDAIRSGRFLNRNWMNFKFDLNR